MYNKLLFPTNIFFTHVKNIYTKGVIFMFIVMIRSIILYILVVTTIRLMGKRQVGQLEPFELVIAIMISDLASTPMQDLRIPLLHGIIPIITLLILQSLIAIIELKSQKFSSIVTGKPSILIENGKINVSELKKQGLCFNDLMEELRLSGYYDITSVEYVILETSGKISVIPKSSSVPPTRKDLNILVPQDNIPITLILDGKLNEKNLKIAKKTQDWLYTQLKCNNIGSIKEIFIAILDTQGKFFYQLKE